MPCVPRTFDFIFFPAGLRTNSHKQKVLARLMAGLYFLRGAKGGRPCLLFVLALYLAGSPRKPPYACSGSHGLTVIYPVVKLIRLYRVIAT